MKFSRKHVLSAIVDSGGIKKNIAARLGCSRQTLDRYLQNDPVIAEAYLDEKEKLKDLSEERLIEQIQMGNLGAIIWYQKTQCRDRGYIERVDQDVTIHAQDLDTAIAAELARLAGGGQAPAPGAAEGAEPGD